MASWSNRKRLGAATIVFALTCATLFQFVWVPRVTNVLVEAEAREIHRQIDVIGDGLTPFFLSNQYAAIYENLDSIVDRYDNWLGISLVRADQRQIYPLRSILPERGPSILHLSNDIELRGEHWGHLEAQVDLSSEVAILHDELRRLGLTAMVALLALTAVLGFLADRLITLRLAKLADAADELGSGNYDADLPKPASDEIGRLTESFGAMRAQILENTSSLESARRHAEAAAKAKSQFLATMSHELRTPLNGIIPVAELLGESKLDAEQQKNVETIQQSSNALLSIVDDILDLTKFEDGRFELREKQFDIPRLITSVVVMLKAAAERKDLHLVSEIDDSIVGRYVGDEDRIRQILVNLVGNSIKFTNAGTITIRCRPAAAPALHDRTSFLFEVEDTGIGIDKTDQQRIFERFEQAEGGLTRRFGGSGLGLSISKSLVTALGGEIGLKSKPGEGSTFWFRLPLEKANEGAPQHSGDAAQPVPNHASAPSGASAPLDILVADDNEINREVTTILLQNMGHNVRTVTNGREALGRVTTSDFDVVFMDVHMPEMDGLEATRCIRTLPTERAQTYIIALTASVMEQDILDCRKAGMDDVLTKPATSGSVREALKSAFA